MYNERGPKYKVRDDVIKKLNSMNESFESDLERKLVRMWFNEKQASWLVKHDPETAEWLAYGNIRTQDLIDVEQEINKKMSLREDWVSVEEDPWLNYLWSACDDIDNLQDIDYSADNCKDIIFTFGNSGNLGYRVDSLIDAFEANNLEGDIIDTNGSNVIVVHFFDECTESLDKDAIFTKNRYNDKIYYHGFMDKKDADKHYPDRLRTKTYWYSTRHGVMPGSVPKGINILDVRDIGNKSYFKTDSIISSKDLKYYDIKEDVPPMEESKRSSKKHSRLLKENAYIKTFKLGDPEFENLYKLADILTKKSPNKYVYYVGDTYFDLGQDWMWTTVLCRGNWSSYQALNPREQEEAILANSDAELEKIADSVLSDKYCPDKKKNF